MRSFRNNRAYTGVALAALLTGQMIKPAIAEEGKATTSPEIALFATVCMKTSVHGVPRGLCAEFQLTPGAAGPTFSSVKACNIGMKESMDRWLRQAGPGLGIRMGDPFSDTWVAAERCGPKAKSAGVMRRS